MNIQRSEFPKNQRSSTLARFDEMLLQQPKTVLSSLHGSHERVCMPDNVLLITD